MNIACGIEYDGTEYHGFQRQPARHGATVQGTLEAAIERISGTFSVVTGAGRTDAGVHASGQVIHFQSEAHLAIEVWLRALNALLPKSIAIRWTKAVPSRFHARFSALSRSYRYTIWNDPAPTALRARYSYHYPRQLDVDLMNEACQSLLGSKDFGAFGQCPEGTHKKSVRSSDLSLCRDPISSRPLLPPEQSGESSDLSLGRDSILSRPLLSPEQSAEALDLSLGRDPILSRPLPPTDDSSNTLRPGHCIRDMFIACCTRDEAQKEIIVCDFTANAFLTGQVRRMVGTLLLVGQKRLSLQEFAEIVQRARQNHPGSAAPAHGLCLRSVEYPDLFELPNRA